MNPDRPRGSIGFSPAGYNQIVIFSHQDDFRAALAANDNMTAIIGDCASEQKDFPSLYVAGILNGVRSDFT